MELFCQKNWLIPALIAVFSVFFFADGFCIERGIVVAEKQKRAALVIGNSAYESSPLKNPENDARDIANALGNIGFETSCIVNADREAMEKAIRKFGKDLTKSEVGLFFYAGHGMQVKGINYLIPVAANIEKEADVRYEAVDAGRVLAEMENAGNGLNVVILDACRNNPFARSFRSSAKGLARMDAPTGTYLAYATAPDSVAADGDGENGVFTKHLLSMMPQSGMPIEQVMKRVRRNVMLETGNRQVPWDASSLTGDFFFVPGSPTTASGAAASLNAYPEVLSPVVGDRAVFEDDGADIWELPEILPPDAPAEGKTVVRSGSAVGETSSEACARATTDVTRKFFKGRPSDSHYRESVYRMYCSVIKRMQNGRVRAEVTMEFYK